jgi:hypothetical protein
VHQLIVAQAYFSIGGRTIELFGPRAEQIAHLLALDRSKVAANLADRIGKSVSDAEGGEHVLELDDDEERELLVALDEIAAQSEDVPDDVERLRDALRRSLAA